MPYETMPIVGAYYRPPAQIIINTLPIGVPLLLLAEPTNDYDPNAIAVYVESKNIPEASRERLAEMLPDAGYSLQQVLEQSAWHLGYIPKEMAAQLKASGTIRNEENFAVTFVVNAKGAPRVRFPEPVL